jgi:radical SAM superfamily enzyme YgiQ (UPF0313 family)
MARDFIRIDYVLPDARSGSARKAPIPSLTMGLLLAQTPPEIDGVPVQASVHAESADGPYDPRLRRPDILCLSVLTTGAPRAYELAAQARDCSSHSNGKVGVVMGGIHPTALPQEALGHADAVVCGETPPELQREVLVWVASTLDEESEPRRFALDGPRPEMLERPCPDFSWVRPRDYIVPQVLHTSVGCPYNCSFCTATRIYGARMRPVARELIERDVAALGRGLVAIIDDNFLAHKPYDHARRVCAILRRHQRQWVAELTARDLSQDTDLIPLFAASGCYGVYIGIESAHEKLPKGLHAHEYKDLVSRCHDNGLLILGAFVFGVGEEEDEGVFEETVRFADTIALDFAQFSINTPEPGSRDFEHAVRQQLITDWNWEHYDGGHPVRKFSRISEESMYEGLRNAYLWFYSLGSMRRRLWPLGGWRQAKAWPYNLYLGATVRLWLRRTDPAEERAEVLSAPDPAVLAALDE